MSEGEEMAAVASGELDRCIEPGCALAARYRVAGPAHEIFASRVIALHCHKHAEEEADLLRREDARHQWLRLVQP